MRSGAMAETKCEPAEPHRVQRDLNAAAPAKSTPSVRADMEATRIETKALSDPMDRDGNHCEAEIHTLVPGYCRCRPGTDRGGRTLRPTDRAQRLRHQHDPCPRRTNASRADSRTGEKSPEGTTSSPETSSPALHGRNSHLLVQLSADLSASPPSSVSFEVPPITHTSSWKVVERGQNSDAPPIPSHSPRRMLLHRSDGTPKASARGATRA